MTPTDCTRLSARTPMDGRKAALPPGNYNACDAVSIHVYSARRDMRRRRRRRRYSKNKAYLSIEKVRGIRRETEEAEADFLFIRVWMNE